MSPLPVETVITSFKSKQIKEPTPKIPGPSRKTSLKFYPSGITPSTKLDNPLQPKGES